MESWVMAHFGSIAWCKFVTYQVGDNEVRTLEGKLSKGNPLNYCNSCMYIPSHWTGNFFLGTIGQRGRQRIEGNKSRNG